MIRFEVCDTFILAIRIVITLDYTFAFKISQNIRAYDMTHVAWVMLAFCEGFLMINYFSKHKNRNFHQQVRYNSKLGCCSSCNHQYNQCGKDTNRCILRNSDYNPSRNQNHFHMTWNKTQIQFRILWRIFHPIKNLLKIFKEILPPTFESENLRTWWIGKVLDPSRH